MVAESLPYLQIPNSTTTACSIKLLATKLDTHNLPKDHCPKINYDPLSPISFIVRIPPSHHPLELVNLFPKLCHQFTNSTATFTALAAIHKRPFTLCWPERQHLIMDITKRKDDYYYLPFPLCIPLLTRQSPSATHPFITLIRPSIPSHPIHEFYPLRGYDDNVHLENAGKHLNQITTTRRQKSANI